MFWKNKYFILYGIVLAAILAHSIYRDIELEKQYSSDLRNRVVGSRLQKDGKIPYFYHWTSRDGMRYLDPENHNQSSEFASNITASPFFHELLFPVCNLPERTLSRLWTGLEYVFLACMAWLICSLTRDRSKRYLIIAVAVLFTTTEAWKCLIAAGQLYLFISFLMSCIIAGLMHNEKAGIVFAGICAAALVLSRPIGLVIFLPFLIQYKKNRLFLMTSFAGLVFYGLFVLLSPFENALWRSYHRAIEMHVKYHQDPLPASPLSHGIYVGQVEGFDFAEVDKNTEEHPITVYSECGNVFTFYEGFFHRKMPVRLMYILSAISVLSLSGIFFFINRNHPSQLLQILILGLTLYMVLEVLSPIHRHQYNTVQWFPTVLAGFLLTNDWKKPAFLLLFLGLLLNIINTPWILMRHTLGELCWLVALLIIVYTPQENQIAWKQQS